jgi:hypothetical protein
MRSDGSDSESQLAAKEIPDSKTQECRCVVKMCCKLVVKK